jgi:hypothetical protein
MGILTPDQEREITIEFARRAIEAEREAAERRAAADRAAVEESLREAGLDAAPVTVTKDHR